MGNFGGIFKTVATAAANKSAGVSTGSGGSDRPRGGALQQAADAANAPDAKGPILALKGAAERLAKAGAGIKNQGGLGSLPSNKSSIERGTSIGQAVGSSILGMKTGGRITKSGVAMLHKGETVVPASKERKALRKSARRSSR